MILLSFLAALVFAAVHLFIGRLRFLAGVPRSRWLSFAGGVAVAYVFLHLLPDLGEMGEALAEALPAGPLRALENHIYILALVGLTAFYGLERMIRQSKHRRAEADRSEQAGAGVFHIHIASFALYNLLIGYLLVHREDPSLTGLLLYVVAMGLHFVTNDFGLRDDHRDLYDRQARYILAATVLAGWGLGVLTEVPEAILAILFAFLAGGVVLNVLKEELPEERQSRFGAFLVGAVGYAIVLLVLGGTE